MSKLRLILVLCALIAVVVGLALWSQPARDAISSGDGAKEMKAITPAERPRPTAPSTFAKLTDPSIRWQVRVDQLKRAETFSEAEVDELFALLAYRPNLLQAEPWWVVANEIMEQLRQRGVQPDRFAKEMLSIAGDANAPEVLRDYAVQHLSLALGSMSSGDEMELTAEQTTRASDSLATLTELVRDPALSASTIPGTTLTAIADLHARTPELPGLSATLETLQPWFGKVIAGETRAAPITRATAINTAGLLGFQDLLPAIRTLASDEATSPTLRLNAISALGQLGTTEDQATLQQLANSSGPLRFAAQSALRRIDP